jgi:hypothetical protein
MLKLNLALASATIIACVAPAVAQTAANSQSQEPVWNNVSFGMTRGEVEALYPRGAKVEHQAKAIEISDVNIIEKCNAEVNVYFDDKNVVDKVMIAGDPSMGGRCSRDVMAALASKYGQPVLADGSFGSIFARQGKIVTWVRPDGTTLQFKKFENGVFGGGGLAKASWELVYTKRGAGIGL